MKKSKKIKNKKTISELKKLKLFGDSEIKDSEEELDNIAGGSQSTTVETHWPTTSNNVSNK
ncbi:hypothetical protein [Pontibacter actiniarum]|uniref:Bacteriocin n=1 Tax=Pontibacter actiniarum TaxID=323450 RepID=A0A1X9YS77_9BACT|nr:hypothetical protein [Pontibacter actiniarum]ARS35712.1 hypothetical protein CA264_09815 [Pontibacter actiniarum]